ncbi:GNAT family N-acetyltransferase [Terrilactibacillus sp. S3-3]|nr:GNAT family N-acetyltransferase [Terrilactibacillus sp. S3-3]
MFHSSEKAYERPELGIFSPIIRLLAVHPAARGHGIARELLKASVNDVKKQGFTELYLHTSDKMAKAIRLYERFGFQRDLSKDFQSADIHVKCYRLDI